LVGHKEERFILPILPPLTVLVGNALTKIKKHSKKIFGFIFLIFLVHCSFSFVENYNNSHTGTNSCFNEAMQFIEKLPENSLIITDETPIVYAYTHRTTRYYPTFWSVSNLENKISENETDFTYIFYTDMDMPLYDEKNVKLKKDLDENYDTLFVCDKDWGLATVYKFSR